MAQGLSVSNLPPIAVYRTRCRPGWTVREIENDNATPYVNVAFAVKDAKDRVYTVYKKIWLTDNNIENAIRELRRLGWMGTDLRELGDGSKAQLDRNEVEIDVIHTEYKGNMYAEVRFINEIGGSNANIGKAVAGDKLAGLSMKFKQLAESIKDGVYNKKDGAAPAAVVSTGSNGAPPDFNTPDPTPAPQSDDLPF